MPIPWQTIYCPFGIYVALPLIAGYFSRKWLIKNKGLEWFNTEFLHVLTPCEHHRAFNHAGAAVLIQRGDYSQKSVDNFLDRDPTLHSNRLIFALGYGLAKLLNLSYHDAAPAAMIGASNHFEGRDCDRDDAFWAFFRSIPGDSRWRIDRSTREADAGFNL